MPRKLVKYQIDEKKYADTREIFDSLFGKALRILFRRENQEEEAEKYEKKRAKKRKRPKLVLKDEATRRDKIEVEAESGVAESLEKLKQDGPRSDERPRKDTEKRYQSPIKYEKAEKAKFKPMVEAKKSRRRRRMSKKQHNVGSSKRRTLLAFVLLLALAGAYFYYQSGGDLGKLTETLKSIKKDAIPVSKDIGEIIISLPSKIKGIVRPEEAKKVAQEPAKKPAQIARKPMPKSEISPPPQEAAPQKNLLIVKKPPTPVARETQRPAPRQSYRRVVKETPKPVPRQPYIPAAEQSPKPATEVSRPHAVKEPPKVVAHTNKPKVTTKASTLPAKPPVSYPYSIYLGSYGSIERAEKAVSMYEKKGLSPYWVEVDLGEKGVWYRIFTGYFPNKEEAEAYIIKKQIANASSKRTAYANLIGVFQSQYELNRKKVTLSKLGYSPYVIAGINGESLLYAGAFYQKARAEKQHMRLASNGIRNRVVIR
jgi:septal ring-binding cell division protein DamX